VTKNLVDFTAAWRIDISYGCPLSLSITQSDATSLHNTPLCWRYTWCAQRLQLNWGNLTFLCHSQIVCFTGA